jgi:hypothetical protein
LEQAIDIYERLGDRRNWAFCLTTLCLIAGFQGEFRRWIEMAAELYTVAHANEHGEYQAWGLSGQAMAFLLLGQTEHAAKQMDMALPFFASFPSALGEVFAQGTLSLLCLRQGQPDRARQAADTTARLLSKTSIPFYSLLAGYAAAADVYLALWEQGNTSQAPANSEMRLRARQACKALHRFARTYPIGGPHDWLCQGRYEWLEGRPTRAQRAWLKSLAQAEQLRMPYQEGLAHYELGRQATGEARRRHLTRAREIFEHLDAGYDLQQARAAKEGS